MKLNNIKGFAPLAFVAAGVILGLFTAYVGHLPR